MKAATLILAREHFVDFFDFDIPGVVFLCEAECLLIVVVLENVSDIKGGGSMDADENCDDIYRYISSEEMSRYTGYMNSCRRE